MYPRFLALVFPLLSIAAIAAAQYETATVSTITTVTPLIPTVPTSAPNASDILTYPPCAQYCSKNTFPGCTPFAADCVCGAAFATQSISCAKLNCGQADFNTIVALTQQLCGPVYTENSTLSSSVSAAVSVATAAGVAAVSGKDVSNPINYPQCAQNCLNQVGYLGCGSLSNRTCVCTSFKFGSAAGGCEVANCTKPDLGLVLNLVGVLCASVFNITTPSANVTVAPTISYATVSPTIAPFQGTATSMTTTGFNILFVASIGLVGIVGFVGFSL